MAVQRTTILEQDHMCNLMSQFTQNIVTDPRLYLQGNFPHRCLLGTFQIVITTAVFITFQHRPCNWIVFSLRCFASFRCQAPLQVWRANPQEGVVSTAQAANC